VQLMKPPRVVISRAQEKTKRTVSSKVRTARVLASQYLRKQQNTVEMLVCFVAAQILSQHLLRRA
jgi:hypothetical protein